MDQQTKFQKILDALNALNYQVVVYFTDGTLIGNLKERSTENILFIESDTMKGLNSYFKNITVEEALAKYNKTAQRAELHNTQKIDSLIVSFTGTTDEIINQAYNYLYPTATFSWDILDEEFVSQGNWEIYPAGPVEFVSSQVKFSPTSGTISGIASGYNNPPFILPYPLPAQVTIEFKFKITNYSMSLFMIRTNVADKYVGMTLNATQIKLDNMTYTTTHNVNVWYTYRLVIDGNLCKVYKKIENGNFALIPKNFTPLIVSSGNRFDLTFFAVVPSIAYLEYVKVGTGISIP